MMVEKREKGVVLDDTYDDEEESSVQLRTTETLLRLLPVGLCVAALAIMLKNSQSSDFGRISYSTLGAFTYLVHANGICAGYSLISAAVLAIPRPSTMSRAWTFFLLDQILTYAMLAAGAASTELLFLSYHGDTAAGWSAACLNFGMFCRKARTSIVISHVVVVVYIAISFLSSYTLFSKYAPPVGAQSSKEVNTANI